MRFLLLSFLLVQIGCSSIKETHTQNVKAFARSTKALSSGPGILYQNISDFRYDLRLIETSVAFSPTLVIKRLDRMIDEKQQFDRHAKQINEAANIIDSYAECLLALTDDAYENEWKKQSDLLALKIKSAVTTFNTSTLGIIPASVGDLLGNIVNKIGYTKLKHLQKQYLKSFVDSGAIIIDGVCAFFTETASVSLENEIATLDQQFDGIMITFYDNLKNYQDTMKANNPYDYYRYYNPVYLQMKERLTNLHKLQKITLESFKNIQAAHQKLKVAVDNNETGEILPEIKQLYSASNEVRDTYQKIKKS